MMQWGRSGRRRRSWSPWGPVSPEPPRPGLLPATTSRSLPGVIVHDRGPLRVIKFVLLRIASVEVDGQRRVGDFLDHPVTTTGGSIPHHQTAVDVPELTSQCGTVTDLFLSQNQNFDGVGILLLPPHTQSRDVVVRGRCRVGLFIEIGTLGAAASESLGAVIQD